MRNRTSRNALAIAVIGLALLAFSGALLAQQLTGNIFGDVTDEQVSRPLGIPCADISLDKVRSDP